MNTSETGSGILDFEVGFRSDHVSFVTISKASHGEPKKINGPVHEDLVILHW